MFGLVWFTRCTPILSVERPPFFFFEGNNYIPGYIVILPITQPVLLTTHSKSPYTRKEKLT